MLRLASRLYALSAASSPSSPSWFAGYHPWWTHWITLNPEISKRDHYSALFPSSKPGEVEIFENLLTLLPDPIPLDDVISDLRQNFDAFPRAMLGEVGLDRSFRVAFDYFASPKQLTPFTIPIAHQLAILEAQLDLAVELGRNVSFHSVKAQLNTLELMQKMASKHGDTWRKISVDMHSCGLSAQSWNDIQVNDD